MTLTVRPLNTAPVLGALADVALSESQHLRLAVTATDVDAGEVLSFSLVAAPAGATLSPQGQLDWTAPDGPASANFTVRVTDRAGASSQRSFNAVVANLPPQVTASGAATANPGQPYSLTLAYVDVGADAVSSWFIDWGDGSSSTLPGTQVTVTHVFTNPGKDSLVSVRAQDDDGLWAAVPLTVRVLALPVTPPPAPPPAVVPQPGPVNPPTSSPIPSWAGFGDPADAAAAAGAASAAGLAGSSGSAGLAGGAGSAGSGGLRSRASFGLATAGYGLAGSSILGGGAGLGYAVQTAHPFTQAIGFATVDSNASGSALRPESMATLLDSPPADAAAALQVRAVVVTGHGLRVRFNQVVDVRALATGDADGHIVVQRDSRPVKGRIVVDADGQGFVFVADGGLLPDGSYTVRLPSRGAAKPGGEALDGDYDGKAGGDYRGRFTVTGAAQRLSLGLGFSLDGGASFERLAAATGQGFIALDSSLDWIAQRWQVQRDSAPGGATDTAWTTLTGGFGGLAMLAAAPAALDIRLARRALAAGARRRDEGGGSSNDAPIRIAPHDPQAAKPIAARRAPGWVARWLGGQQEEKKGWRIRL